MLYIKAQLQEILNHFSSWERSPALSSQAASAAIVFLFEFIPATLEVASRRGKETAKFRCCSGVPWRSSRVSGRLSETKQHLLFFWRFFHTNPFFLRAPWKQHKWGFVVSVTHHLWNGVKTIPTSHVFTPAADLKCYHLHSAALR